jgi:hypothetical protein
MATRTSSFGAGIWSGISSISIEFAPSLAETTNIPIELLFSIYGLLAFILPVAFLVLGGKILHLRSDVFDLEPDWEPLMESLRRILIYFIALAIGFLTVYFLTITVS